MITDQYARLNLEILKIERLPRGSRSIAKLLQDWGLGKQPQECFWVIAYDVNSHIRTVMEVARGGHTEMSVDVPSVLTAVLGAGASIFTVAHNHPAISVAPSVSDVQLTHTLMDAANACGLIFEEHLIVGPTDQFYSFVDGGLLAPAPRKAGRLAAQPRKGTK